MIIHLLVKKINNQKFIKSSWKQFDNEMQVSLYSIVMILKELIPQMMKQKYGRIIIMLSSYTLNIPPKFLSSYVTVKYALLGLIKSLSVEYANKGITINGISPEMIETKFLSDIPKLIVQKNAQDSPLGRNLYVQDIIPMFLYLLSDEAEVITGQNFGITGGM